MKTLLGAFLLVVLSSAVYATETRKPLSTEQAQEAAKTQKVVVKEKVKQARTYRHAGRLKGEP